MPRKASSKHSIPSTQTRRNSAGKSSSLEITSQSIATDLAAFRKQGGRIEVLGNTPLRTSTTVSSPKGHTARTVNGPSTQR